MLSDEEKEALEILNNTEWDGFMITIKNLIEKQSKEIEELKKPKYIIDCKTNEITKLTNDFVSKDKIKAKIEEIQQRRENDGECELALHGFQREAKIEVLQSLLEKE